MWAYMASSTTPPDLQMLKCRGMTFQFTTADYAGTQETRKKSMSIMALMPDGLVREMKNGKIVVTAKESIDVVKQKVIKRAAREVDVVTAGTFGPMCSYALYTLMKP